MYVYNIEAQELLVEVVDRRCLAMWNVAVTEVFSHHGAALAFCEGTVVAVARARFGEIDARFFQRFGNPLFTGRPVFYIDIQAIQIWIQEPVP